MYENGRKVNRHANKRKHIDHLKKSFMKQYNSKYSDMSYEEFLCSISDFERGYIFRGKNIPYCRQYWKINKRSKRKQDAKRYTSKVIRNNYRDKRSEIIFSEFEDYDDILYYSFKRNNYQKFFDFWWYVY